MDIGRGKTPQRRGYPQHGGRVEELPLETNDATARRRRLAMAILREKAHDTQHDDKNNGP